MKALQGIEEGIDSRTAVANEAGACCDESSAEEDAVSEDALLVKAGVSALALRKFEENDWVKAQEHRNGAALYSQESVEHVKSMMCSVRAEAVANLQEAHQVAQEGASEKARREQKPQCTRAELIDPSKIKTHSTFEGLLPIDEDLLQRMTVDMRHRGYYVSKPVVLGIWPGLASPVLIDGHTRVRAAIAAGIEKIPFVIEEFESEVAALQHAMSLQTKRRKTGDDVIFRLVERFDELMSRGRHPLSEGAKEIPPRGGNKMGHSPSAQRTAHLVECSSRKVERIRTIIRNGTPEIQTAVRDGKMSINKAYNAIIKKGRPKEARTLVKLSTLELRALGKMGGNIKDHVKAAVREYIQRHRGNESHAAELAQSAEGKQE